MNQTEEKTMFKNAGRVKRTIEEYFVLTVATLILVVGVYVFKFPNNFSFGGVTGIAVVLSAIMPTTPGNITFIINMALLVLGFIFLGKSFGIKTVYVSVLMSVGLSAAEKWFPMSAPLTSQPVLELIYAIVLPAASSAILFNVGASGGGTDIIAMILKKYTKLNIGVSGRPVYCTCILPCLRCADRSVFPLRTSGKITGGRQCDREY
jgi:uncharacterized membrane-anchored protein YitT (DUF2179 family)